MSQPTISLCIPTFNRAWSLRAAIDSALEQSTDRVCEILVMDDGSTDETPALVQAYADPRVRYVHNPLNQGYAGMSRNWNRCLELARGDYVAICGDDDWLAPDFASAHAAILDARTDVGMVYCACRFIDLENNLLGEWIPFPRAHVWSSAQELEYLTRRHYLLSAPMLRRQWIDQIGTFDTQLLYYWDWEYFLRWAVRSGVGYIAEPLYGKRLHDRKLSLAFDTGKYGEQVSAEGAQIVARVLARSDFLAREIARLNRRRYAEIAKAELAQAARALRQRDGAGFWRGARNAWNYQVHRAGLKLFPQLVWDAIKLWRKQKQGRIKYVFDV